MSHHTKNIELLWLTRADFIIFRFIVRFSLTKILRIVKLKFSLYEKFLFINYILTIACPTCRKLQIIVVSRICSVVF